MTSPHVVLANDGRHLAGLFFVCALGSLASACGGGGSSADAAPDAAGTSVVAEAVGSSASMPQPEYVSERDAQAERFRRKPPPPAPAPAPAPAPTPAPAPAPSPAPAPAPVAGPTCGLADFQANALARINQWRAQSVDCRSAGLFAATTPLVWNDRLLQAAAGHSQDMAQKNYFSHTSQDGRTMVDRINATGYSWSSLGENIAAGYPSINAVVDGWIASDGHCANLMNPGFRDTALACVPGTPSSNYRTYWTMDIGKPR